MVPQGLLQVGRQLALLVAAVELDLNGVAAILQAVAVPAVLGCNSIDIDSGWCSGTSLGTI